MVPSERDVFLVGIYLVIVTTFFTSGWFLENYVRARGVNADICQTLSEFLRKLNHVGCGVLVAMLPWLGASALCGAAVGVCVFIFLAFAERSARENGRFGFLFKRAGASSYALGLVATSLLAGTQGRAFTAAYLVLAVADPCANAVGRRFPLKELYGKSLGGFLAHFFAAAAVLLVFWQTQPTLFSIPAIAAVAIVTSCVELASRNGWDNLTVPLSAVGVLTVL
ncbi:MAG: hypothetical protein IOD12_04860 [Silvanigrellales bacterium]|jgi:dolichol kinase|nr:hypothetical protein [Silvanigrellales bacterium]